MQSDHLLASVMLSFISTLITEYIYWLGLSKYYGIFINTLFPSFHYSLVPFLPYGFQYDQMTPAADSLYLTRSFFSSPAIQCQQAWSKPFSSKGHSWGKQVGGIICLLFVSATQRGLSQFKHLASSTGEFVHRSCEKNKSHWGGEKKKKS